MIQVFQELAQQPYVSFLCLAGTEHLVLVALLRSLFGARPQEAEKSERMGPRPFGFW